MRMAFSASLTAFVGDLHPDRSLPLENPDFYNWNRVKIKYCDGGSFSGNAVYKNGPTTLYFRGARIWQVVLRDLLPKGLGQAKNALLFGCSSGGLSAFLHCENFTRQLPPTTNVKCLSDACFLLALQFAKRCLSSQISSVNYSLEECVELTVLTRNERLKSCVDLKWL